MFGDKFLIRLDLVNRVLFIAKTKPKIIINECTQEKNNFCNVKLREFEETNQQPLHGMLENALL